MKPRHAQTIWLVRHAARQGCADEEWKQPGCDPADTPLTEEGILQAKLTGRRLVGEGVRHVFSSPMWRAVGTAGWIADRLAEPVRVECGLCEWLNPKWFHPDRPAILSEPELAAMLPRIDLSYHSICHPAYPETRGGMTRRFALVARSLAAMRNEDVLLVTHGEGVRQLTAELTGQTLQGDVGLCSLTRLVHFDRSWKLDLAADLSHLL